MAEKFSKEADNFVRYVDKVFGEAAEETIENGTTSGGKWIDDLAESRVKVTGSFSDETLQSASKHLSGGSGQTTFQASTLDELTSLTDEALSVANDSNVTMQGEWKRVDVDMGRVIGTNGETSIRIIIDENGIIRTTYPLK